MSSEPNRRRALARWAVKGFVSAAILALLFAVAPIGEVMSVARRLSPLVWGGGLAVFLLGHAVSAAKWRLLIGPGVSYPRALQAHLAGLAANLCLPSVAGGDVVRAGMVYRQAKDRVRLALGSVADRLVDTLGLAFLAALGAWRAFGEAGLAGDEPQRLAALAAILVLAALGALFLSARLPRPSFGQGKLARLLSKAWAAAADIGRDPQRLALALLASLLVQGAFIGVNIAFAEAGGVGVSAAAWVFAWSAAKIIAIAPVSLGGLGVREASTAALLLPFGADPAAVIAVGLLWQSVLYASGLIGLLLQLPGRGLERAQPQPSGQAREPTQ